jgi:MFS family permease
MPVPRSVRWKYYAYRATTSAGFFVPISVIYLLDKGYGVEFVALVQATFSIALVLTQVPSGYLADRLGRRGTLAVGSVLRTAALVGYPLVDFAAGYLVLKVLFGAAWAFRSGTKDAWLYELLAGHGDADEFARIEGRGSTVLLTTSAAGAVAGGIMYGIWPELPFIANAALAVSGLPILAAMPASGGPVPDDESDSGPLTVRGAVRALRLQASRPAVRWVVVYTCLLFLVFDLSRTFEQPALDTVGVPVAGMGVLYAAFKLVSAGAASTVGWLNERLGTRRTLALAAPVLGLSYASLAVVPVAIVPVLFLYRSARAVLRPVRNQYLNDRLGDTDRATILSGVSMVLSLAGAFARVVGGEIAAVTGAVGFLAAAGAGLALAAGGVWLAVSPVRPKGSPSGEVGAAATTD